MKRWTSAVVGGALAVTAACGGDDAAPAPPLTGSADTLDELVAATLASSPGVDTIALAVDGPGITPAAAAAGQDASGPMTPQRPFRVSSNTKTFVAAAVLRLVEQEGLALDDTVADRVSRDLVALLADDGYDPSAITIEHLLRPVVEAGFTCLKLDFLCGGALPGRRHDDEVGREAAYRRGVELVRDIVGDDVYLLACGAPIVASLGPFDGIRVGPDVAPWWEISHVTRYLHDVTAPSSRYAVATSLHRMWLGAVIDTDPDVAYFRTRHSILSSTQRRHLQDVARIAGFRATSDPPAWLDADERAELTAFLEHEPAVEHLGGHRYRIDDRDVDLGPVADEPPDFHRWERS